MFDLNDSLSDSTKGHVTLTADIQDLIRFHTYCQETIQQHWLNLRATAFKHHMNPKIGDCSLTAASDH